MTSGHLGRVAVAVSLVLAAQTALIVQSTGQSVALTSAKPSTPPATTRALGAAEADNEASAVLTARLQNRRIEVLSARTADSTTWALPTGELETTAYAGPVRVKQGDRWQDIDTTLKDTGADLTPGAASADITVSDGGDTALASVSKGKLSFGVGWQDRLPAPEVKDNTASYDLGDGQHLTVSALAQGITQNVVLDQRPQEPVSYRMPMDLDGLKLTQADSGHLLLKDADGRLVAEAPAPVMWDATKNPASGEPDHQDRVATKVETDDHGRQTLVLTPSADFLATATYPVTVDPTSTLAVTTDTWVQTPDYPDSQVGSQELKSGTYDTGTNVARSYLKFNVSPFMGKHITSATMSLYSYYSSTCTTTGPPTQAKRVTSTLDTAAVTWGAQPSTTTDNMAVNTGHWGYNSSCPAAYSNWTLTAMVQDWADGAANNGIQVRSADEKDPTTWRRFRSANYPTTGYAPKLTVTYNTKPATPTGLTPVTGTATTDTTPTLQAKATDADGSKVYGHFEIWDAAATKMITSGDSSQVASGAVFSWTPAALTQGAYKWRVLSRDGTDGSAWSAWNTLTVDTTKPAATVITSEDFPAGAWAGTPDTNGEFSGTFTFAPPANDVTSVVWNLDNSGAHTLPTTGTKVSENLTVAQGKHTLSATTHDKAGNVSALATYVFYAGSGTSLDSPSTGDSIARRVSLAASSDSAKGYTGVTYQFRRGESDVWWDVPLPDVTKSADQSPVTAWPVPTSGGNSPALTWNVTTSLSQDGVLDIRAVFTSGTATAYSQPETVTVDRDAGTAPTAVVGPGVVNELTGSYTLSETDASAFAAEMQRTYSSRANPQDSEGQAQIFGPGWTSAVTAANSDYTQIRRTSGSSVELLSADGGAVAFTSEADGGWQPETGSESLTLTGQLSGRQFTLRDTDGTTAVFTEASIAATTWTLSSSAQAVDDSTVTTVSESVSAGAQTLARPKYVISPTAGVPASTCQAAPSTKGCRVLEFVYADATTGTDSVPGDHKDQIKTIKLWATAPGASTATAETVTFYSYDAAGRLRQVWDPRISPPQKTQYSYDSSGRVTALTKPGELPWTFTYGHAGSALTAGAGMLLSASRPALAEGSENTTSGTATTTVVYDIPLSGTKAPHQMDAATLASWGQAEAPVDAAAVFPADGVPASSTGSDLSADSYGRATITYINANGQQTNSATPGDAITTTAHDQFGHEIANLTAANRELALGTSTGAENRLAALGLTDLSTADRARQLATVWEYSTSGTRLLNEYGPLHRIRLTTDLKGSSGTLAAGSEIPARLHASHTYDENRPAGAAVSDLVTTTVLGAAVADYSTDGDTTTATTTYDWATGQQKATQGGATNGIVTSYDSAGRVVSTRTAGSSGTDADTLTYAYYTADGSGPCGGRAEWAGLICRTAPAAAIAGAGSNPTDTATTVYTYDRWGQTATKAETANGVTRTTTITTDNAGRNVSSALTGGTGTPVPATTITYDQNNGRISTQSSGGQTISYTYDKLGRLLAYDDGAGNKTNRSYDSLDRTVSTTDTSPSTVSYAYDTAGNVSRLTDSVAGTFTGTYDADGALVSEDLPGGYDLAVSTDTAGNETAREYTSSDGITVAYDTAEYAVNGQQLGHTQTDGASVDSTYAYDSAGRLTQASDTTDSGCTTRAYSFDANSNRTSLMTTSDDCDSSTTDATTTTTSYHYDTADRLVNSGYTYDPFGRTVTTGATSLTYYANDLAASETVDSTRNTWSLDAAYRLATQTTQTKDTNGQWTDTAKAINHYGCACDSPTWSATGQSLIRNVRDLQDGLGATTSVNGNVILQFTNIHGDTTVRQPTDVGAASTVQHFDEYGNMLDLSAAGTYGWLGRYQRPSNTLSGAVLMGVRLYTPATGRFLSTDPVYGGNSNAYTYPGDPINELDLTGRLKFSWHWYGLRIRFNKHETVQAESWAGLSGKAGTIGSLLKMAKVGVLNYLSIDAYFIEKKAKWAQKHGHCLELQWWWLYPGFVPYTYWGKANGCK